RAADAAAEPDVRHARRGDRQAQALRGARHRRLPLLRQLRPADEGAEALAAPVHRRGDAGLRRAARAGARPGVSSNGVISGTHYRRSGAGRTIILIHGVGADLEMWEPVAALLARDHDVVRYDLWGHGGSAKPPGPYDLDDFVEQLRCLVDGLGLPT